MKKIKAIFICMLFIFITNNCLEKYNLRKFKCDECNTLVFNNKKIHNLTTHLSNIELLLSCLRDNQYSELYQYLIEFNEPRNFGLEIPINCLSQGHINELKRNTLKFLYYDIVYYYKQMQYLNKPKVKQLLKFCEQYIEIYKSTSLREYNLNTIYVILSRKICLNEI